MRFVEALLRRALDLEPVAAPDGVAPRHLDPGRHLGDALEPVDLRGQPAPPLLFEVGHRDVRAKRARFLEELLERLRVAFGELRRPVVAVDEPVDVLAEPEPEAQVPLGDLVHAPEPTGRCCG